MPEFIMKILSKVKKTLRQTTSDFDDEIYSYIETCCVDLQDAGILSKFFRVGSINWSPDARILQAIRWYCLSVFGLYNEDMEKYANAYSSLKSTLCTQRKYTMEDSDGI